MIWLKLALKNIIRRPIRSTLTVSGVAVAIAILFSLMAFQRGYESGLRQDLNALGAHIMIVPKGCPYEASTIVLHGGKWPRYMKEEYLQKVKGVPGIEQSAGIIMDAIVARSKTDKNRIFLGVDEDFLKLRQNWQFMRGGWFTGPDSMIIGSSVAEAEGLKVGSKYHVHEARGNFTVNADFRISGILKPTNTQDDGFYFMPTKTLQEEFNLQGKLVVILVKVKDVTKVDQVTAALKKSESSMNVFPLTELLNTMGRMIGNTKVFVMAIVFMAIAIGTVGVLNTILMTVFERTKEIGMMKAIGASRLDVFRLIWLETLVMCTVGGLVGVGLSMITSRGVEAFIKGVLSQTGLISVPKGTLISFNMEVFAVSMILSVFLGLAAGAYPAWRASSIRPIEAIRAD